jgi:TrmH family RNA methyltransferase
MVKWGSMIDVVEIASKDNRRLVELRKLRDGVTQELIFLEGRRLVEEALRSDLQLEEVYFSDSFTDQALLDRAVEGAGFAAELPARIFDSIADTRSPQGLIATALRPMYSFAHLERRTADQSLPLVIMLAGVNNPSNLGAIVRSAEAADAAGMITTRGSADALSPKALRAGMGSNLRLPCVAGVEIDEAVDWARKNDLAIVTTEARSELEYTDYDWKRRTVLVFGSEAHGVGPDLMHDANASVRIPMRNGVESLNLGVSAGIILFEARRQNG